MPTTSNFGWTTPADTDLVKNGALAIRTLGNGIDTSMAELKGGTTGQILSKTSNTDMDFTWINNDQGDITAVNVSSPITGGGTSGAVTISIQDGTTAQKGAVQLENSTSSTSTTTAAVPASVKSAFDLANAAIPKSTVTTNGDLIYGTGSATVTRLGIGTSGQVLTVSSGVPAWTTVSSGALTKITSQTFSASSAVNVNDVFSSTYKNYKILVSLSCSSSNQELYLRYRVSGSDNSTTNYATENLQAQGTSVTSGRGTGATSAGLVDINTDRAPQEITIFNPFETEKTFAMASGVILASTPVVHFRNSGFNATTSFTGFSLIPSGGTITGEVIVYGYGL